MPIPNIAPRTRGVRRMSAALLAVTAITAVVAGMALAALPAAARTTTVAAPPISKLHTSGSQILDSSNAPFRIRAVNWFGMETPNCAPHGLWQISLDSGMAQIAGFGFNTIRLPYSNQCLRQTTAVQGVDAAKNPALQGKTPLQVMDAVIAAAAAHGLRVILDRHRPDSGSQSELWYTAGYSESDWIADWVLLAKRYVQQPAVIGADLHNEPHGGACWGCGDASRDWAAAATRAGNAVLAADPRLLIMVEGVEHQSDGTSVWWGGGLADAARHPITLAVPHQLVYSAHDYPASIFAQSWFQASNYPANLPGVWDAHFGYLQQQNIAPVLLGEFGTKLETVSDQQWLSAMVSYLNARNMSFAYWSFNPNSGDTGGLVKDDWVTPQAAKLTALEPLLGTGSTVTPTPAPTTTGTRSTAPSTTAPSTSASSPVQSSPTTPRTATTAPGTTAPGATVASSTTTATGASGVSVVWTLQSAWNAGYVADVTVSARQAVGTWSISWPDSGAISVAGAWGMTCTVSGGRVRCTGADWAKTIPAGSSVQVGLQVNGNGQAPRTPVVTVG